ncbi:MAG: diapophytoene dehydrogenase [Candidatus Marinimicrobia bacterium]|nr:diapophytoene dehydrogenase [Candidatus Neomarinimicrobiota bacterium]|tara:strand:+ start:100453 stop:101712 length:1260 start_codon:yes stop_codon:yes gene_type:complete
MVVDVVMPKMGESITEGTILEWRKNLGDSIEKDEILLEIGTDKVDSEIPSSHSGTLVEVFANPNDVVEVGKVIAKINTDEDLTVIKTEETKIETPDLESTKISSHQNEVKVRSSVKKVQFGEQKKFFTPVVLKIASEEGISISTLETLRGTGRGGRVTKRDILEYIKDKPETPIEEQPQKVTRISDKDVVEMNHMRKLIADHMRSSLDTSAHVYVITEVDVTDISDYLKTSEVSFKEREGFKLTYTPFIMSAVVKALHANPDMNASIDGSSIVYHKHINIGIAVAINKGLMVPVISKCEELNFLGLCRKVNDVASRTRNKMISPDELQGSTFSITNFGVFNVTMGTPIINQPNVGILGIGTVKKRPVVIENSDGDSIGIRSMLYLSLGFDHRLIDGAGGSQFIDSVRINLEEMDLNQLM